MAQTDTGKVKSLLSAIDKHNTKFGAEKLYITFDKPYYAVGDTIWFKTYLLNAATKAASLNSNKIYVELLNDSSQVRERLVIPVTAGLGNGDFKLETNMAEGAYTIRAYTNWMQNFGEEQFFHHRFYIGKPTERSWVISEQHQIIHTEQNRQVKMAMQIRNPGGRPVVGEAVTLRLLDGRKGISKADVVTGVDGSLTADLQLPVGANSRNLSLLLISKQQAKQIKFPFYTRTGNDIDLQFMPEGGNLVTGLYNKVAFKAVGEDGLGVDAEGTILNNKGEEVSTFKSLHKGMGNFALVPAIGETYTAKLNLPNGQSMLYNLPVAKTSGIAMRVDGTTNKDTVRLYISGTADKANAEYVLIAQGKGNTYFGTSFKLTNGAFNTRIPANKFPTGILNLMVTDIDRQPLLSRNVFIDRGDGISLAVTPDKAAYVVNDSIALNIGATSKIAGVVQGNFTVSITDDALIDPAKRTQHLGSYMLLSSELKGNIEDPAWYFSAGQPMAAKALDNLLLTQGWIGFDANKVFAKKQTEPIFWAESDNTVEGELRNFFNKPATNRKVTLMNYRKDIFVLDTVSDNAGRFKFTGLPTSDTVAYFVKIHNARGKEAAVGINVKEFTPAPLPAPDSVRMMPWFANTDTTLMRYLKASEKRLAAKIGPVNAKGDLLKQVNIKSLRKARLQGERGEDVYFADLDIDDKILTKQGNISLFEYLKRNIPEFHKRLPKGGGARDFWYMKAAILGNIIIDSVPVTRYYTAVPFITDFFQQMLENIPAASVKNMVVYHKPTLNGKDWYSLMYIKTRLGNGPVLKETPGIYIYRPLPLYMPREFYKPKYLAGAEPSTEIRSTLHWEPNLVTNEQGQAKLSFYAADKPGIYTVTIEGTDMQGHFGATTRKIVVGPGNKGK
ncbi:hypothetical protein GCM10028827_02690 [Mucilaginibacter myungsuensis]